MWMKRRFFRVEGDIACPSKCIASLRAKVLRPNYELLGQNWCLNFNPLVSKETCFLAVSKSLPVTFRKRYSVSRAFEFDSSRQLGYCTSVSSRNSRASLCVSVLRRMRCAPAIPQRNNKTWKKKDYRKGRYIYLWGGFTFHTYIYTRELSPFCFNLPVDIRTPTASLRFGWLIRCWLASFPYFHLQIYLLYLYKNI